MEIHLPSVPMMKIFSYLDAFSLLQVAQVNKSWNAVASSDDLWRKFYRKRWLFCDRVNPQLLGTETWKQFFTYRTWQEHAKSRAEPEDYTYKEIPVDFGVLHEQLTEDIRTLCTYVYQSRNFILPKSLLDPKKGRQDNPDVQKCPPQKIQSLSHLI